MIKSIYLENWKTHLTTQLSFQKGTNILLGVIGSGKTSIVDAICYALYGTYPSLSSKKITLEETIMFKPVKQEHFKVVLEILLNNNLYTIEREVFTGTKPNSAKVYFDNKLISGPKKTDVDAFVSKLLGIDYALFVKVVYSQQNEIDYFLKIPSSKRKEQFDELFGISHFENIKSHTRELERLLSQETEKTQALLSQLSTQLSTFDLETLESQEKQLLEKLSVIHHKLSLHHKKKQELSQQLEVLFNTKKIYDELSTKLSSYSFSLKNLEKDFLKISQTTCFLSEQELKEKQASIKESELSLKAQQEQNKKTEILKNSLENKLSFLNSTLQKTKKEQELLTQKLIPLSFTKQELSSLISETKQKLNALSIENNLLLSKKKQFLNSLQEIKNGFSMCPVCQTPFTQDKLFSLQEHMEKDLSLLEQEINKLSTLLQTTSESFSKLNSQETIFEKNLLINTQLQNLKEQETKLSSQQQEALKQLSELPQPQDLSSQELSLKQLLQTFQNENNLFSLSLKIKDHKQTITHLTQELSKISFSQENFISLLADQKNQDKELFSLEENKNNLSLLLTSIKKQLSNQKSLLSKKHVLETSLNKLRLKKQDLSYFQRAIESSQYQLRKILINNVNQALSLIWSKVYPYKDYVSARLNADNDYILEVLTLKDTWIRVEGILSGGERACASLSIRIAISLILTKSLGLLILDEPTHNLDEASISSLLNVLENELPLLVEQTFIVTHESKLSQALNATKFIVKRDKQTDSVSSIV